MKTTLFPFSPTVPIVIAMIGGESVEAVHAKALHDFLGVRPPLPLWVGSEIHLRRLKYEIDYVVPGGSLARCLFTVDTAKHISMGAKGSMGKLVREYYCGISEQSDPGGVKFMELIMELINEELRKRALPKSDLPTPSWDEIVPPQGKRT
jgi:phage anti-repressor protein